MEHEDILAEINALLGETVEAYDPAEPLTDNRPPSDAPSAHCGTIRVTTASPGTATAGRRPAAAVGFRHGRLNQPSDRQTREKLAWLTQEVPRPPPRAVPPPPPPPRTTPEPLRPVGPSLPPTIPVEVEPGITVHVPHFAVHSSREYKPRLGNRRWHLRFDRAGRLRSCKEKSYPRPVLETE